MSRLHQLPREAQLEARVRELEAERDRLQRIASEVPGMTAALDEACFVLEEGRDIVRDSSPGHTVWMEAAADTVAQIKLGLRRLGENHGPVACALLTDDVANLVGLAGVGCVDGCTAMQCRDDDPDRHHEGCLTSRMRTAIADARPVVRR